MVSFFERLRGRRDPTSAEVVKERLKLVLVTDRSDLSPEKLAHMQAEIIHVINKYMRIDEKLVNIKLEQRDRKTYLVADIPLVPQDKMYRVNEDSPPDETAPQPGSDTQPHQPDTEPDEAD